MKKIFVYTQCFFLIILISCNKSMTSLTEQSKPDILFSQVKNDPLFWDYLNSINATMKIIQTDVKKGKASDSLVLKDKSKTVEEKFTTLKYTGLDSINNEIEVSKKLFTSISKKYPLILSLNKDESKSFFKEAYAYFYKIKTK